MKRSTLLVHAGRHRDAGYHFVNPPVIRASTVLHESVELMHSREVSRQQGRADVPTYGIWGTPTHEAFYEALCALEGGAGAWAFSSGLAACTVPLMAFVQAGDHALIMDSVYGPTRDFALSVLRKFGVEIEFFDPAVGDGIAQQFKSNTRLVVMETPGSHSFELPDVRAIAAQCRAHDVFSVIDNTWATPLYFQPLSVGVDVVVHAATKFIAGHSDVLMGTVVCSERAWPRVFDVVAQTGQAASADDVYLAYRGLHTLQARLERSTASARSLIDWLQAQPQVERVLWPALETDPFHAIWKRDFTGATGLFGVVFKPEFAGRLNPMINALQLFGRGYSWGGFESLLIPSYGRRDCRQSPFDRMVRVAVGMEDAQDLIEDLEQAFARL